MGTNQRLSHFVCSPGILRVAARRLPPQGRKPASDYLRLTSRQTFRLGYKTPKGNCPHQCQKAPTLSWENCKRGFIVFLRIVFVGLRPSRLFTLQTKAYRKGHGSGAFSALWRTGSVFPCTFPGWRLEIGPVLTACQRGSTGAGWFISQLKEERRIY